MDLVQIYAEVLLDEQQTLHKGISVSHSNLTSKRHWTSYIQDQVLHFLERMKRSRDQKSQVMILQPELDLRLVLILTSVLATEQGLKYMLHTTQISKVTSSHYMMQSISKTRLTLLTNKEVYLQLGVTEYNFYQTVLIHPKSQSHLEHLLQLHILDRVESDKSWECVKILEYSEEKDLNNSVRHKCLVEWNDLHKPQSWVKFFALCLSNPTPCNIICKRTKVVRQVFILSSYFVL
jgi:hypothetical protein